MPVEKNDFLTKQQLERNKLINENTNLLREIYNLRRDLKVVKRDNLKKEVLLGISKNTMSKKKSEKLLYDATATRIQIAENYIDQFRIMINQMVILDEENERLKATLREKQVKYPRFNRKTDLDKTLSLHAFQSPSLLGDISPSTVYFGETNGRHVEENTEGYVKIYPTKLYEKSSNTNFVRKIVNGTNAKS